APTPCSGWRSSTSSRRSGARAARSSSARTRCTRSRGARSARRPSSGAAWRRRAAPATSATPSPTGPARSPPAPRRPGGAPPRRVLGRSPQARRLAARLVESEAVQGVTVDGRSLVVSAPRAGELAELLPRVARDAGARLLEVRPLDDSLESVFRELLR